MMRRLERKTGQRINRWKISQPMKETGKENQKIIRYRYCQWKNLPTWTEDKERKTEIYREGSRSMERGGVCSRKDLDDKGIGQSKVLCSSSGVELPMINYHAGFLPLSASGKQISGYPPASGSNRTTLAWTPPCHLFLVASSYLARFLARLVGCPSFCLAVSWTVGLAMGGAESRGGDVAVGFLGWSLWKVLTIFRRCMMAENGS